MPRDVTKYDCLAEIKRFFRYYSNFCQSPEPDSVREVLASIYSVNDKTRKAGYPSFFDSDEFLAIKAIRNYAIHQAEIYNQTKALPLMSTVPIESDLCILCLLPRTVVDKICENTNREGSAAIRKKCIFYKNYVDIYPCIFNFGVQLFLYTEKHDLEIDSKDYSDFKNSIDYERANGYSHFVKGGISLPSGLDVDELLEDSLHSMDVKTKLQDSMYSEESGMYTFKGF